MAEGLDLNGGAAESAEQAAKDHKWARYTADYPLGGESVRADTARTQDSSKTIGTAANLGFNPIIESSDLVQDVTGSAADIEAEEAADQAAKGQKWTQYADKYPLDGTHLAEESYENRSRVYSISKKDPAIESSGSVQDTNPLDTEDSRSPKAA